MFGAVVHKHAAKGREKRNPQNIQNKYGDADSPFDEVEPKSFQPRGLERREPRQILRKHDENDDGERNSENGGQTVQEGIDVDFMFFRQPFFGF